MGHRIGSSTVSSLIAVCRLEYVLLGPARAATFTSDYV